MRVLIVDDSRTIRRIERCIVERLGYTEIEEACDGQDALSRLAAFRPTLILLDWSMPNVDGDTFLRTLRQSDQETPVIIVATDAEMSEARGAARAGVDNFLVKPFAPDTLRERIQETLAKAGAA